MKASRNKMKKFIKFKKKISFEKGLLKTIDWYKNQNSLFSDF